MQQTTNASMLLST